MDDHAIWIPRNQRPWRMYDSVATSVAGTIHETSEVGSRPAVDKATKSATKKGGLMWFIPLFIGFIPVFMGFIMVYQTWEYVL